MAGTPAPDRVFALPGGLVTPAGETFRTAELRPMTGLEEEWLAAHPGAPSAPAVTRLLAACVVRLGDLSPGPELARSLLVGDRDYLMVQLRRITLGDPVSAVVACPACGERMDVDFSAGEIPVTRRPQDAIAHQLDLGGRTVGFRLPTGADQESVLGMGEVDGAVRLLDLCLLGGRAAAPSDADREAVGLAMERAAPQVDLELALTCPGCGDAFDLPFDTTAFFLHEFRINADQLLREVHSLALYYHWSEAEILGLRRDRRRAYLSLLRDSTRPGWS